MSKRFEVIIYPSEEWVEEHNNDFQDPKGFLDDFGGTFYEDQCLLYDNLKDEIVWADGMEPEDATLTRDLSPLVVLLNQIAEEKSNG